MFSFFSPLVSSSPFVLAVNHASLTRAIGDGRLGRAFRPFSMRYCIGVWYQTQLALLIKDHKKKFAPVTLAPAFSYSLLIRTRPMIDLHQG
jgi:hypothetical protein